MAVNFRSGQIVRICSRVADLSINPTQCYETYQRNGIAEGEFIYAIVPGNDA